jgi:hypothetical protein
MCILTGQDCRNECAVVESIGAVITGRRAHENDVLRGRDELSYRASACDIHILVMLVVPCSKMGAQQYADLPVNLLRTN